MNVWEQISQAMTPHRQALQESLGCEIEQIRRLLEHSNRLSDLGRPDTQDTYARLVRRGKLPASSLLGRPKLGEYWLIQLILNNGVHIKSPNAVIRTNVGALLAAITKETMFQSVLNGVAVLPGEEIELESESEGEFDLTIHLVRRKIPQKLADAVGGVNQGDQVGLRGVHEPERYLPDILPGFQGVDVPEEIAGDTSETQYGGVPPELTDA